MDWFVKAFLKAALTWLSLGVSLGVAMAAHVPWLAYRAAHLHMLVLGFVTMTIFGVAYHVIPRFAGHPLHHRRAPVWHWWISNTGLAAMVAGFVGRAHGLTLGGPLLVTGGLLSALGAYTFAWLIWRTIDGPAALRRVAARTANPAAARLPLAPMAAPAATGDGAGTQRPAEVRR